MRKVLLFGAVLVLLATSGVAAAIWWAWQTVQRPLAPATAQHVEITPGLSAQQILERLEERGVLADARLARLYLIRVLEDPPLHAGEYRFEGPRSTPQVLDELIRGNVVTHPVTVIEGLTLEETALALSAAGFGDEQRFLSQMRDATRVADIDPEATDLEGYLFPDTYRFARGTSESQVVDKMVATFRRLFEQEVAPLLASTSSGEGQPLEVRELVSLASIVEKEAGLDEERPLVAGVYANRLRIGMGLYADPTIIFALKKSGEWDGNLRREDLQLDSPYNTYRYPGLPPGPICSPGLASLIAAARPADEEYLYFVSRNDGSHVFAKTLAEHNRNVERWQRQYWRDRWARERKARENEPNR